MVERHIKAVQHIRSKAYSNSTSVAEKMVHLAAHKHPPARYAVGCDVLVRRFSSKSKKKHGKGFIGKQSRILKGTVIRAKVASGRYKVRYQLNGRYEEKWYPVTEITSLTTEDENKRKSKGKCSLSAFLDYIYFVI